MHTFEPGTRHSVGEAQAECCIWLKNLENGTCRYYYAQDNKTLIE